jgi:hypothetical protein
MLFLATIFEAALKMNQPLPRTADLDLKVQDGLEHILDTRNKRGRCSRDGVDYLDNTVDRSHLSRCNSVNGGCQRLHVLLALVPHPQSANFS